MPFEKPRFTPCDTDAMTAALTRETIDTRSLLSEKEARLKQAFADLEEVGIPVEPIKEAVWQYAVVFARHQALLIAKRTETDALNIGANPVRNLLTPKHKD
jgi:hypothetical protein